MKNLQKLIFVGGLIFALSFVSYCEKNQETLPDLILREFHALPEDTTFQKGPYLMHITKTSATIMWETTDAADGEVFYGTNLEYGLSKKQSGESTLHEITLTDLMPETLYYYKVKSGENETQDLSFMTAVETNTPFRFVVYGDSRTNVDTHREVVARYMEFNPHLVFNTGDLVSDGLVLEQWQTQHFDVVRKVGHYVPYYIALGNHEKNSPYYYNYVSYPDNENYYSITYGNAFFLIIDSDSANFNFLLGEEKTWLLDTLESEACQKAKWKFALFHTPVYTNMCDRSGNVMLGANVLPLLETAGFQMIFNGHNHNYETGYINGIYHITTGGGGAPLYEDFCYKYEHITKSIAVNHFTYIDIIGNHLTLKAIDIEGNEIDSLEIQL